MSVTLPWCKIAYFSVPKVACTSIKSFFFELENNRPFEAFATNGDWFHIHKFYPGKPFEKWDHAALDDWLKLAVVRDPVARFLSCYGNRVLNHKALDDLEISPEDACLGVVKRPDLDQYIAHFHRYRALARQIRFHSEPMVQRLGHDPAYFDRLFDISELDQFVEAVRAQTGFAPDMGRHQTEGPKFKPGDLSAKQRQFIMDFYAEDYQVFGKYL